MAEPATEATVVLAPAAAIAPERPTAEAIAGAAIGIVARRRAGRQQAAVRHLNDFVKRRGPVPAAPALQTLGAHSNAVATRVHTCTGAARHASQFTPTIRSKPQVFALISHSNYSNSNSLIPTHSSVIGHDGR